MGRPFSRVPKAFGNASASAVAEERRPGAVRFDFFHADHASSGTARRPRRKMGWAKDKGEAER